MWGHRVGVIGTGVHILVPVLAGSQVRSVSEIVSRYRSLDLGIWVRVLGVDQGLAYIAAFLL